MLGSGKLGLQSGSVFAKLKLNARVPQGYPSIEEGDPEPAHQQEQQHERKGEDEPGAEVHHVALWEETGEKRR